MSDPDTGGTNAMEEVNGVTRDIMAAERGGGGDERNGNCSTGAGSGLHWKKDVVFSCMRAIRKRMALKSSGGGDEIPKNLGRSFMTIIGEVDLMKAAPCVYRRVVNQIRLQFVNGAQMFSSLDTEGFPSDLEDELRFKPTESFGDKVTQILALFCLGERDSVVAELGQLRLMRKFPSFILRHPDLDEAFCFIEKTFEGLLAWFIGNDAEPLEAKNAIQSCDNLSNKAQLVLKMIRSHLLRNFRIKIGDRIKMIKEVVSDDSTTEVTADWLVTAYEVVRRKREVPKYLRGAKHAADEEEHFYVDRALTIDGQNPFVRLALLDCIVDCLRDSRKSFTCGGVTFHTNEIKTIAFMKRSCREILAEFPRNVKFHCRISDYFARFVTLRFFDIAYAEECLETAYKLNPTYPLTTHRMGIFSRMSKGALSASFKWFQQTESLDPFHFNAFLECVKNMIGHPTEYNASEIIGKKLLTAGACSWSDAEILELLYYKGISHFVRKEMEQALDAWALVAMHYQPHFRLMDLDQVCCFYQWDMDLICSDLLRVWAHEENLKEDQPPSRKILVNLLYNIMVGKVLAEKPKWSNNPLECASIFQYIKRQEHGNGDGFNVGAS